MKKFNDKLHRVYQDAYQNEMKQWKGLSIYPKDVDTRPASDFSAAEKKHLTRKGFRWYVYYRHLDPDTEKYEKQIAPTLNINRLYKKFDDRHKAIRRLKASIKQMLEAGYSPYDGIIIDDKVLTIEKALDYALESKKLTVSEETHKGYVIRVNQLKRYLKRKGLLNRDTVSFNYRVIREFLNEIARKSSMQNRNNTLRVLKSLFSEMYENDLIHENYVAKIKIEKAAKESFKSYSYDQANEILKHLEKEDPIMALFIKFIGYNFLRPIEVVRLKVGSLDLDNKLLTVWVKQGKNKTKRIPDEIINDLSKYGLSKKDNFLFARAEISGKWDRAETGRRQYYSKRYTDIKTNLGYGEGYTMYSFRHTYITISYKNLRKRLSKEAAIDELMRYTGHDSREALKGYIHYHDADIVDDYQGEVK